MVWGDTITTWQIKLNAHSNHYRLHPRTITLWYDLINWVDIINAFEKKFEPSKPLMNKRDEYRLRLKAAEAHIQRNKYWGGYTPNAFFGNDSIVLVDETGTGILYKISQDPDYDSISTYTGGIVNYYPSGTDFTTDAPDADKLTMRSDGILVREKSDLSRWYYDMYGRLFRVKNNAGKGYDFEYAHESSHLVKIQDDANRIITLTWNNDKLRSVEDYARRRVIYSYSGNYLSAVTDPIGDITRYEYTGSGRMKKTIKPDDTFIEQHYQTVNGVEVVVGTTDEEGYRENFSYTITNGEIEEATYENPSGVQEVHHIRDHLVVKTSYPDRSFHEKNYSSESKRERQVTSETLRSGEELHHRYDTFGNIIQTTYGDGSHHKSSYRNFGRQIARYQDRRGNVTRYVYNSNDQLTEIHYPVSQGSSREVFTYNGEGLLSSRQVENNLWKYQYDIYGQLIKVTLNDAPVEERGYDEAGNLVERTYANGIREAFTFNADGYLTSFTTYGKDGSIGYREQYAYNNRKDHISTTINDEITDYSLYDRRHKLRYRIRGVDANAPSPGIFADETSPEILRRDYDVVESFTYRADGKLTAREVYGEGGPYRWEYSYGSTGDLSGQKVFFNGNLASQESYHWDAGAITGIFDGEGRGHIYEDDVSGGVRKRIAAILSSQGNPQPISPRGSRIQEITNYSGGFPSTGTYLEGDPLKWHYDTLGRFTGLERGGLIENKRQYDLLDRLTYREDAPGRGYHFYYDLQGRLSSIEGPDGQMIEERSYDTKSGELTRIKDPRSGNETHFQFDNLGRLSQVTDAEGYSVSYHYDAYGRLTGITDQAGETWSREYDALGRLSAAIDPLGHRYEYTYDALGRVKEAENPLGAKYQYLYDTLGQLLRMVRGDDETHWEYDLAGNLISQTLPTGREESYQYDALNHLIAYRPVTTQAVIWQYSRRNDGRLREETDPLGRTRTYQYNARGQLTEEVNQLGLSQTFQYNNQGELREHRDFEDNLYEYRYDDYGRTTQRFYNSQLETSYEYDVDGNLLKAVNELTGNEARYNYDRKGNLISQNTEMGITRYEYEGRGLKTREVRPNQIINFTYDARGSLLSSQEELLSRQKVSYRYNPLGQEIRRDVSDNLIEKRRYDEWGRLIGISGHEIQYEVLVGPLLYGESYVYGPGDQKTHSTDLLGKITSYEYDEFDRLKAVNYPFDTGKVYADFKERLDLGLFPTGNESGKLAGVDRQRIEKIITQAKEKYPRYRTANLEVDPHLIPSPGGTTFRPYRNIGLSERPALETAYSQVFGVRRTTPEMVDYTWREEFSYDGVGSRIEKRNGWGAISYTYSAENRLTQAGARQYDYDNNGNLTEETSGGGRKRYFYNSLNRVRRAEVNEGMARILEYEYDGLGRRIGHSDSLWGETRYGYEGLGLNPVQEVFEKYFNLGDDTSGSRNAERISPKSKPSLGRGRYMPYTEGRRANQQPASKRKPSMSETRSYLYKGRTPIARSTVGSYGLDVSAYGHDALGSVAATVNQGYLEERFRYDAFGGNYEGELETDERGYNGKPHDPVTGLYNYGYRDYDPMTGRFATVDPIRDGRHWYVYVGNDPVNYVDAWGLDSEDSGSHWLTESRQHLDELWDKTESVVNNKVNELSAIASNFKRSVKNTYDNVKQKANELHYNATKFHYEDRDAKNIDLPEQDGLRPQDRWRQDKKDFFHQNGGERDIKWINDDGREVVYDGDNGQILTDKFRGTYNYQPVARKPEKWHDVRGWQKVVTSMIGHAVMDVVPHLILGTDR